MEEKDEEEETGREGESNEVSEDEFQIYPTDGAIGDSLETWEDISRGYHSYDEERDEIKTTIKAWRRRKTEPRDIFHCAGIVLRLVIRGYRRWGENICRRNGRDEAKIQKSMSILMDSLSD